MAVSSIGSGLDVNSIVSQLMTAESRPLAALDRKEAGYQARVAAFGSLNSALTTFQSKFAALSTPAKFNAVSAKSGDEDVVKATADAKAVAGAYKIDVSALAQAQTLTTSGQANTTSAIGDGAKTTLTFSFGKISGGKLENGRYVSDATAGQPDPSFVQDANQKSGSIVIDSSNNSLQGIRDTINKANIGVTATIVSDGSANPYHLVLTSTKTGEQSSMSVAVSRDAAAPYDAGNTQHTALSGLLAYNAGAGGQQNMTQSAVAQDTKLTVNGLAIQGATREIKEAIQGVTLDIKDIGDASITVARDTSALEGSVSAFVKAYNDLDKTIKSLTAYNASTKVAGPLLGESSVRSVQEQLRRTLGSAVPGNSSPLSTLSHVGVQFEKDGTLTLDSAKFKKAVESNFSDLAGLFASNGSSTDSLISYVGSTNATQAGRNTIEIDAVATRGALTGSAAPASLAITAANDTLNVNVNGLAATVKLTAGTYTTESLVAHLQSAINGASVFGSSGTAVSVTADAGGKLTITSNRYGSSSKVEVSGIAAHNLFGSASMTGTTGIDVAGKINGVKAVGAGQNLSGATGTPNEGLVLEVSGGVTGARGTLDFTHGYTSLLNKMIGEFTGSTGMLSRQTDGLKKTIEDIGKSRTALNDKLDAIEKRYRTQFVALDAMLNKMNSTSTYLTQQLSQIASLSSQS